jgi:outer membrane lipoprotein-sorting protein
VKQYFQIILFFFIAVILTAPAVSKSDTAPGIRTNGQADRLINSTFNCFKKITNFRSALELDTILSSGAVTRSSSGTLIAAQGGRIRLDIKKPLKKTVVSDGKTLQVFTEDQNISVTMSIKKDPLAGILLFLQDSRATEINKLFKHRLIGTQKSMTVLEFTPLKRISFAKRIVITLSDSCPGIHRIMLIDQADNILRLTLSDFKKNVRIKKNTFKIRIKNNTAVVKP